MSFPLIETKERKIKGIAKQVRAPRFENKALQIIGLIVAALICIG